MTLHYRNNRKLLSETSGFTLLELLIAIVLLAFISIAIYEAVTNTFNLRQSLTEEADFQNEIRLSMTVLERDIAMVYSPKALLPQDKPISQLMSAQDQLDATTQTNGASAQKGKFWGPFVNKAGIRMSLFTGDESKLSFVSASHIRVYKGSPESIFSKISYELDDYGDAFDPALQGKKVLVRTEDTNAFDVTDESEEKTAKKYPLLHGIDKFTVKYCRKEKDSCSKSWRNDTGQFKDKYPEYIEIELGVSGPSNMNYEGRYRFRLEMPIEGLDPST